MQNKNYSENGMKCVLLIALVITISFVTSLIANRYFPPEQESGLGAFGVINETLGQTTELVPNVPYVFKLTNKWLSKNVSYTPENSITVEQGGIYLLHFSTNNRFTGPETDIDLTFGVRVNGENLPIAKADLSAPAAAFTVNYSGNYFIELPDGAVVDIAVTASKAKTLNTAAQAKLCLMKLD